MHVQVDALKDSETEIEESLSHSRQTVTRLVKELDNLKEVNDQQKKLISDYERVG